MKTNSVLRAFGVALTAALLVGACGADEQGTSVSDYHNDSDVSFAQDMIPHHQQALLMAEAAVDGADSEELRDLAQRIRQAQAPEIDEMTGWLEQWGEEVPDLSELSHMMMGHGASDDGDGMSGMMSDGQLRRMTDLMGDGMSFDRMWVLMMIEHHEGAIEMAKIEKSEGQSPDAIRLAAAIVEAQQAEIDEMKAMLSDWSGN